MMALDPGATAAHAGGARGAPVAEVAIRLEHLRRDFGPVRAVDDLSIDVPAGVVFGFLGPNGSGKTTTIRLLLGLLEPTAGRAEVLGIDARAGAAAVRARCGALLEHDGLYERLSAEENLDYYGRIWRLPGPERARRVRELLGHVGLWERRADRVGTWSRGMKQKLAVARALLHRPRVLFLDEPTAGLDPVAAAALREDLAGLVAREGVTVFLTTHNLAEAEHLCARVAVVRRGRLLALGTPGELRTRAGTTRLDVVGRGFGDDVVALLRARGEVAAVDRRDGRLLIDLRGAPDAAPLVALLVGAGVAVEEVHRGGASLEDAFLALVAEDDGGR